MKLSRTMVVVAVAGLAACSDLSTAPDRYPAALRITPDSVRLVEGDEVEFDLEVLDQDGLPYDALPAWAPPEWTGSSPTLLSVGANGRVTAQAAGESWTEVALAGLTARAVVQANPREMDLSVPFAYITQSVQRREGGVPLVADRDGLLRVFVAGTSPNFFQPEVRASFYQEGALVHSLTLTLEHVGIPESEDEGDLRLSYDAMIPGSVLRPGVGLVLEVDPAGVVPAGADSELRVPASGELPLDVVAVRPFRLRLVPVTQAATGSRSVLAEGNARSVTRLTEDLFPLAEFDVDVREPYTTMASLRSEQGWFDLIEEIALLRMDDGSDRYYYGGFQLPTGSAYLGLGYVGYPVAIGGDDVDDTIAHEIGHTLGLPHAPCGDPAGADPRYPYPDGLVGRYGYDRSRDRLHHPDRTFDVMTYCDPIWISDYNYEKVLAYRDTSAFDTPFEDRATGAAKPSRQEALVVRGGVLNGRLRLQPALEWSVPATAPPGGGRYTLEGLDAAGRSLFEVSLEPRPLDHGSGSTFLVAIPRDRAALDRLQGLRLTGPEGSVERWRTGATTVPELAVEARGGRGRGRIGRWDAVAYPLAVVRDRGSGAIVAMSRTGEVVLPDRDPARLEVLFSDGVGTRPGRLRAR